MRVGGWVGEVCACVRVVGWGECVRVCGRACVRALVHVHVCVVRTCVVSRGPPPCVWCVLWVRICEGEGAQVCLHMCPACDAHVVIVSLNMICFDIFMLCWALACLARQA